MHKGFLITAILASTLFLTSCISEQLRQDLDLQKKAVAALQIQVKEAQASGSPELAALKVRLKEAEDKLFILKDAAVRERVGSGAAVGEAVATNLAPVAAIFFPVAGSILSGIAAALGVLKDKMAGGGKA